jgi:hypothetical protein
MASGQASRIGRANAAAKDNRADDGRRRHFWIAAIVAAVCLAMLTAWEFAVLG